MALITCVYDSRTEKEELDAVKLLIDKINVPNLLNWQTPLYDVGRNGCIALHYYVHFFLFRHSWDRK